jgi:hypothetical protein
LAYFNPHGFVIAIAALDQFRTHHFIAVMDGV